MTTLTIDRTWDDLPAEPGEVVVLALTLTEEALRIDPSHEAASRLPTLAQQGGE